ncbi:MAG: DUF4215 domain-containing protein [Saprospiraceae bacterium]|nr:DUF4215 domain-containing protein [Saprospiraceae bacterium]
MLLSFSYRNASAQCVPTGTNFTTQAQIDAAGQFFDDCPAFFGNITVNGADITNLDSLIYLTSITGSLQLGACPLLTDLSGLANITSISGSLTVNNNGLSDLTGLNGLTSAGSLIILNSNLTSLNGLSNLTTLVALGIQDNSALASLDGLSSLVTITAGGLTLRNNGTLGNISGLGDLASVTGNFVIDNNDALLNLDGLIALGSINGEFELTNNAALASITGLGYLGSHMPFITISNNPSLTSLEGLESVDFQPSDHIIITNNANLSVCNILNLCEFVGDNYPIFLTISGNSSGSSCSSYFDLFNACGFACGNGVVEGYETCDDGNNDYSDGCAGNCNVETGWNCTGEPSVCTPICGDGLINVAGGEGCDDGDTMDGDGCSAVCEVEPGWECTGEPSVCTATCGDGIINGTEECDDGDTMDGDGCSAICEVEIGWNCTGEPSACTTTCGDGIVVGAEGCDDGDTMDGDGCSAICEVEPGWECTGEPSVCNETCPTNITFSSQAQINSFQVDYPGCTIIGGSVTISGADIVDLSPLNILEDVLGLYILDCPSLTVVDGFNNIPSAFLTINNNDALVQINGFSSLNNIPVFYCNGNAALTSIQGMGNLTSTSQLFIGDNPNLTDISGLGNINPTTLFSIEIVANTSLSYCSLNNICTFLGLGGTNNISSNAYGCQGYFQVVEVCNAVCGNGTVEIFEGCDDGDTMDGDGCSAVCEVEPGYGCTGEPSTCTTTCGDGIIAGTEECDDGDTMDGDGCSAICEVEIGWNCTGEPSACATTCGDGIVVGAEGCDDGDTMDGDGCSAVCEVEPGYGCTGEPSTCTTTCGDGIIAGTEECDDGDSMDGDGCSAVCEVEAGWNCTGEPSVCVENCPGGVIPGTLIFHTQSEVNAFPGNYPGCNTVESILLYPQGPDYILDLTPFSQLTNITGTLLFDRVLPVNYQGFHNVVNIGHLFLNIEDITDMTPFASLQTMGSLTLRYCHLLTSLTGLENVSTLFELNLEECDALPSLDGLDGLANIHTRIQIENCDALTSLSGLGSLTHCERLNLFYNASLNDISSLTSLNSAPFIYLYNSPALSSLNGLGNIEPSSISSLILDSNGSLSICDLPNICQYLRDNGTAYISSNAVGCANQAEVEAACAICGDGLIEGTEGCDDGNTMDFDGCSSVCAIEPGWGCYSEPSFCNPVCGDGLVRGTEGCDDGNTFDFDGCNASCEVEPGWICPGDPSVCVTVCGDGLIRGTEACDDDNNMDGDGCSSTCEIEPGYSCYGEPSICAEAGDYTFTGSGFWSEPANWDANGVPPPVLPTGSTITIDGTGPCTTDIPSLELGAGVSLTVFAGNTLAIDASTAIFVGGSLTINGTVELTPGVGQGGLFAAPGCSILNNGSFDIAMDRGIILMGSMNNTGSLANNGYLYIQPGGQLDNCGTFTNNGTISSEGSLINCASATIVNAASGQISCTAEITSGALINHGGVIVGCSPGLMTVMGDFTTDGDLNMELEGTTAIQQYDQLSVTGVATLSGTMSVTFLNGFTPAVGNSFTLITYGSRVGTFSTINIPCPACWNIDYQAGQLVLTYQSALPVELVNFTATPIEQQVQLDWQTATETNNHGFDLQRSQDAKHWESITWINGHGNSQATQNYQHMDKKPKPGTNYYRLRQVDFDGASKFSKLVQVEFEGREHKLEVLPNPNAGQFRLALALPKGINYQVSISNTSGQTKWIQGGTSSGAFTISPLLDSPLPSGIYFVKASTAWGNVVKRMVVQ